MIQVFAILLGCQLAGEILARGLRLPMPGPVIGLVFLLAGLALFARRELTSPQAISDTHLGRTTTGLLQNLSILFVPAGVGVIDHLDLLSRYGLALAVSLIVSTALTLAVTALVFTGVKSMLKAKERS
jgi:holin-like protein